MFTKVITNIDFVSFFFFFTFIILNIKIFYLTRMAAPKAQLGEPRKVAGSILTQGAVLCSRARHFLSLNTTIRPRGHSRQMR